MSAVAKMLVAIIAGVIVGILTMLLKDFMMHHSWGYIWRVIDRILFADITAPGNATAIGLFFIIKTLFIAGLQFGIVPLVITSISLSMCSLNDLSKLGRIAAKTILAFSLFYVLSSIIAVCVSVFCIKSGFFCQLPIVRSAIDNVAQYTVANPLALLIKVVPTNMLASMTTNSSMLAVVFIAIVLGLCINSMPQEVPLVKELMVQLAKIVNKYLDFIINTCGPVCIFCMLVYTFATFGMEQIKQVLLYMLVTFTCLSLYIFVVYPLTVSLYCRVSPLRFLKKTLKVVLWAFAVDSSAASLPLNRKTTVEELGCSEEVTDFVLPIGMTVNMNGTTIEHVIAVAFIATAAGFKISPLAYLTIMILAIGSSAGTPAIPNAGVVMIYATMTGAGFSSDMCIMLYTLLLTLSKPIDMAVVATNVVGDAEAACSRCSRAVYQSQKMCSIESVLTNDICAFYVYTIYIYCILTSFYLFTFLYRSSPQPSLRTLFGLAKV